MDFFDPLYGKVSLEDAVARLSYSPAIQRLRHIGLSNIDSVSLPGITGTKRYEHVIAVAYLSTELGLLGELSARERVELSAAALLHDWAIGPFGHLLEEAAEYSGVDYDHERKLESLLVERGEGEIGGAELQILGGRQTKLREWAVETFKSDANNALSNIGQMIIGTGRLGKIISGSIDIDNLDNVSRMAYHMGLELDRRAALKIARGMESIDGDGNFILSDEAIQALRLWVDLRTLVYENLMLATPDFSAKTMIVHAAAAALQSHSLSATSWVLTEHDFITKLSGSNGLARTTIERWLVGEYWSTSPLLWFELNAPTFRQLSGFDERLSRELGRKCYSYRIKDKRYREITVKTRSGDPLILGSTSKRWLLGVSTPEKKPFSSRDLSAIAGLASQMFSTPTATRASSSGEASLF